jgi:hypothetical protein
VKPVDQAFLVARDGHGDCLRACVASVLEVALDEVPDFSLFGWNWMASMALFCEVELIVPGDAEGYWIAMGTSPRGIGHVCVYLDGALAHDPHPSRGGLVGNVNGGFVVKGLRQNVREWREKHMTRDAAARDGRAE